MYTLMLIIHVIVSLFLIFIILIQSGKGEGMSDVFGGGSSQTTIFGTRTGTFLTKATTGSAIIFMITCVSLAVISRKQSGSVIEKELMKEQAVEKMQNKPNPQPEKANTAGKAAGESPQPAQPTPVPAGNN
ncbi:MAG: preprotein translocase subunit SecG [Candidatus Omnitrophica bacterium]|nr:preprotein translocase subunit SecG [Candidatus Omnitrophota bacterium]MBU4477735.1 preprotein translocase subunit SecG [Candidatus Omnitrophota bacterium]MCG2703027.1 preprotein translocase subunit SecG [Candidatus Omnitrophota bacterium]